MLTRERFAALAEKYMDMVFRVAYGYMRSRDDADDVTQEVLLRLYRTDTLFESEEHVKNWLIRVTVNQCKKVFRSPWRRVESIEDYASTLPVRDRGGSRAVLRDNAAGAEVSRGGADVLLRGLLLTGDRGASGRTAQYRYHTAVARKGKTEKFSDGG